MKCDWKAANAILNKKPELVRYCITENGETPLHVAVSVKGRKHAKEFVKNLVGLMNKEDFELEDENFNTALYLAAVAGELEMVKIMVGKNKNALIIPGSGQMMPLYAAALSGNYDVVKYLYDNSKELADGGWTNQNRRWLLEKCVENDMFDVALKIVEAYPNLGTGGVLGILARKPEVFPKTNSKSDGVHQKETKALRLLRNLWENIEKMPKNEIDKLLRGQPDSVKKDESASGRVVEAIQLQKIIHEYHKSLFAGSKDILKALPAASRKGDQALQLEKLISEQLVKIHVETQNISGGPSNSNKQDNTIVSGKGDQALELQKLIFKHVVNMYDETQKIIKNSGKEDPGPLLHKLIIERIYSMDKETNKIMRGTAKKTYSSRVLFIAAEMGNTTFLVELIHRYPDLIWKVNDNNQTIFHIAVEHRHQDIYNLLYEIGSMKDLVTALSDEEGNNMLHLAGKIAKQKQHENVVGVTLQMQGELVWFREVENMIPASYKERKNKDGLTPYELFTQEHKELATRSEKWIKSTANQCLVVAALFTTMVFAAAFTIPGGYDQSTGIPIFRSKATFIVFVVADAFSLFSSSASVLLFLSIITSSYEEHDFLEELPDRLFIGIIYLLVSIVGMTVACSVSFFVIYDKRFLWIPILVCLFAGTPLALYSDILSVGENFLTDNYKNLFNPKYRVLYYENPKV